MWSNADRNATPGSRNPDGLTIESLACERGDRLLFTDLDVTVRPGQLLRVEGANGAGKTSLLRAICGLLPPLHGRVLWHGTPIAHPFETADRCPLYLGHADALKAELSALENLHVDARLRGLRATRSAALAALAVAGLAGREHVPVRILSQGQRRRAALARLALAETTPLWVLDEPFNALDRAATQWLVALLTQHVTRRGVVVLTSHQGLPFDAAVPQVVVALGGV